MNEALKSVTGYKTYTTKSNLSGSDKVDDEY